MGVQPEEYEEIRQHILNTAQDDITEWLLPQNILVHRNYMSDGPVYAGPVYVIIWPGSPDFITVLIRAGGAKEGALVTLTNYGM